MSKKTEIHVDDILHSYENNTKASKVDKDSKKKKTDDWGDEPEEEPVFSIGKGTQQTAKPKTTKKKAQGVKGWDEFTEEQTTQKPAVPEKQEFTEVEQKKRIFKKPTGETKPTQVDYKVNEEYFPSLGEELPKHLLKQEEPKPQVQESTSTGPKRFVNVKKSGGGENFAPIEKVEEKEVPQRHVPTFQRGTEKPQEIPAETQPTSEGKFKFGGEGPKRFVSQKPQKKEEEKTEQDLIREQKEREVEEKLLKEKEQAQKEYEAWKAKKESGAFDHKKPEERKERPPKTETHQDKPQEKAPDHDNGEPKKITKFSNTKKPTEPVKETRPEVIPETKAEPEITKAKETEIVVTSASNKGWDEGGIIKKSKKKV